MTEFHIDEIYYAKVTVKALVISQSDGVKDARTPWYAV